MKLAHGVVGIGLLFAVVIVGFIVVSTTSLGAAAKAATTGALATLLGEMDTLTFLILGGVILFIVIGVVAAFATMRKR